MGRRSVTPTTFSLYHMEETSHLAWLFMNDSSGNGLHLSNADYVSGTPTTAQKRDMPRPVSLVNAFGKGKRGRWWSPDTNVQSATRSASPGTLAATFQGQWTIKLFIRVDSLAAKRCIYAYAADGESTATNTQASLLINTDGTLEVLTEDGALGDNRVHTSTAALTVGALAMVHVVKTATHYRFYLNGVFIGQVAIIAQPTGGTSCIHNLGRNLPTATQRFVGAMRSVMIRSVAESDADITAQIPLLGSASVDGTLLFTDTTNVVAHWVGDEAPDAKDECERGMHLCQSSSGSDLVAGVPFLAPDEPGMKYWSSGAPAELVAPGNHLATTTASVEPNGLALQAMLNTSDWSVGVVFRPGDGLSGDAGLWLAGSSTGSDLSPNENFVGVGVYQTDRIRFGLEHNSGGTGVDGVIEVDDVLTSPLRRGFNHLVVTRNGTTGVTRVYLNKTLIGSDTFLSIAVGSAAYWRTGFGTLGATWFGTIGPTVIDAREWDQDDVDDDYETIFSSGDATEPVIQNVVYPEDPWDWMEFDVYDADPGLGLVQVLVQLGNEEIREAAYDEGAFRGRYLAGGSTLTGAGTSGSPYHFKLRPAGGWPVLPSGVEHNVLPRFVDGSGNLQFGPEEP
jgi:hypothetical protein